MVAGTAHTAARSMRVLAPGGRLVVAKRTDASRHLGAPGRDVLVAVAATAGTGGRSDRSGDGRGGRSGR